MGFMLKKAYIVEIYGCPLSSMQVIVKTHQTPNISPYEPSVYYPVDFSV